MTTVTLELPTDLLTGMEHVADETGQPLETVIADVLIARFAQGISTGSSDIQQTGERIRLRPVRLNGWQESGTFRREDMHGDDAR